MNLTKQVLTYSFEKNLSHIPSALSMIDYLYVLFYKKYVTKDDYIIIGKPFGSQAYYIVWENLGLMQKGKKLSIGVKHDEIPFVTYSEETIGNALGVAIGIALTTTKKVWVNITDASLQMGNVLEAIQFIGQHNLNNIFLTIDNNNAQVTGQTCDIINVVPVKQFFSNYNWNIQECDGHNISEINKTLRNLNNNKPNVVFFNTIKGGKIKSMSSDIKLWHYKKISSTKELDFLLSQNE